MQTCFLPATVVKCHYWLCLTCPLLLTRSIRPACLTIYSLPSDFVALFSAGWNLLSRTTLLGGELLAERCRTDDLTPSISLLCHSQTVNFAGGQSAVSNILCGVPQGSALGPILFLLYCADVRNIAERHDVTAHSYADDMTLSCTFTVRLRSVRQRLVD